MGKLGRKLLRLFAVLIVIALTVVAIVQSWYQVTYSYSLLGVDAKLNIQYTLTQQSATFTTTVGESKVIDTTWTESWTNSTSFPHLKNVYVASSGFVYVGLITFVVSGAILVLDILPFCGKKLHHFVRLLALIAAVIGMIALCLAPALVFRQPKALQKDYDSYRAAVACSDSCSSFAGSDNSDGVNAKWGPAVGWYLCWAAFGVAIIAVVLISRDRKYRKHGYRRI